MKRNVGLILTILCLVAASAPWAGDRPGPLGESLALEPTAGGEPRLGVPERLHAGLFTTHGEGAVVRLDNGRALRFEPNSAGLFEAAGRDDVKLTVLSGRVVVSGPGRHVSIAGANSTLVLSPADDDPEEVARMQPDKRER